MALVELRSPNKSKRADPPQPVKMGWRKGEQEKFVNLYSNENNDIEI